ncbi:MAG: hypothetical protein ACOC1K_02020 [Nanoarchaeota archaeon]
MSKKTKSPKLSFKGWKLWEYIKGRKKMVITVLGSILGLMAIGPRLESLLLGPVLEAIWAIIEYFYREYK